MADEKKLLPVVGLDQAGIIKDVPGHILPPNAFTDGKNVFFKNNSVQKRKGTIKAVDDVSAIVATVNSTSGNTMTFDVDPALTVDSEFTIANATPSAFNGTYNVTAVSETGKTITVSQTLTPYTSGGTYTFTPKIDFVDYWPAPNNPQYIEVQQNDAATPAAPVFNSIRSTGIRERISLKTYEVEGISQSTTPTITIDGDPFNLTNYDVNGTLVVKPIVEREIKAGETLKVFGASPTTYDGNYVVTSITYNTGTNKTEISCSSASVDTSALTTYIADSAELRRDTFSPTSYLGITSQDWQSAFFAGGYAYIINNGYHTPHYLLASLGANYVTPQLTPLPGWDWQRYLGEEVHAACKVIRGYKDTLIAGNFSFYPISAGVPALNPVRSSPGTIRISRTAAPGEIPSSWQPDLTEAFVEERELSTTSAIMDIVALQGTAMVYTTDSIHSITYDSRGNVSDQVVAEGYGALETGCVLEFDGKHIVIGADDIYMFGGHPGSIQSICDGKIRNYFYDNLNPAPAYLDNIFMIRDTSMDEIHIYYPTKKSPNGFCDEYLAWNYRNNTWTINECDNLVSGTLAPVRGGGVAGGTVTFSGVGNTTTAGRTDQQKITVDLTSDYDPGDVETQTLYYFGSRVASTYAEEQLNITVPSDIIPFSEEVFEFDFHDQFDSGASSRDIGEQTGSTSGVGTYDVGDTGIDLNVSLVTRTGLSATGSGATTNVSTALGDAGSVTVTFASGGLSRLSLPSSSWPGSPYTFNFTLASGETLPGKATGSLTGVGDDRNDHWLQVEMYWNNAWRTIYYDANYDVGYELEDTWSRFRDAIRQDGSYSSALTNIILGQIRSAIGTSNADRYNNTYIRIRPDEVYDYAFVPQSGFTGGTLNVTGGNTDNTSNTASWTVSNINKVNSAVKYELINIPLGSDVDLVIDSQTLTENSTSHTFEDTNTSRSWSITGTIPTVTHASTTNADGTLATGSGTTSPTDISGFSGFDLTEAQATASATTASGSGNYPRIISHTGNDSTTAVTSTVSQNIDESTEDTDFITNGERQGSGGPYNYGDYAWANWRYTTFPSYNNAAVLVARFSPNSDHTASELPGGSSYSSLPPYPQSGEIYAKKPIVTLVSMEGYTGNLSDLTVIVTIRDQGTAVGQSPVTGTNEVYIEAYDLGANIFNNVTSFTIKVTGYDTTSASPGSYDSNQTFNTNEYYTFSRAGTARSSVNEDISTTVVGTSIEYSQITCQVGQTTYSISNSFGSDWSQNTPTVNSTSGLVTFPTQYKTTYTLTNGSSVPLNDVSLTIGGVVETPGDNDLSIGESISISFGDSGSARSWSVSTGTAAEFELQDNSGVVVPFTSFPANVGATAAVSYAASIITSSTEYRAQAKSSDNTVLQVFAANSDVSGGSSSNISIDFNTNDGSNVGTTSANRTAQAAAFTQYQVEVRNNNNDQVILIEPIFNDSNITLTGAQNTFASEVGEYLRDQIISAVNSSGFMTNEPDWYDNGSSGAVGSDYVIRIGTQDIENYSFTLTNINTTTSLGAFSGSNNTLTFSDTLSADSTNTPDTVVVKSPTNTTITSLTTRSGEAVESIMERVASAIQADTNDGWDASHDGSTDSVTFTATAQGRYPVVYGNGAPADLVYTDYAVIKFDYTQGTNIISPGNITDLNAAITQQGSDEAVKLTIVDPSRDNNTNTGPFEDVFEAAGTTSEDIANSIKARMDLYWPNWTTTVTDTGVASSGSGNKFDVNLTSVASDWILKDRVTPGITANDVVYPTDRAVFVKKVEYGSGVTGSSSNATSGTNFDADSNQSPNFAPSDIRIGYPTVNPTSITATVIYENKETLVETPVVQTVTLTSAGNSDSMASSLASVLNSSAVPALSASASGSIMTITTNDLTQRIKSFSFTFDEQTTQGGRNSVSRTNGNNIAGSAAVPTSNFVGTDRNDDDRPYATNEFNLNKFYPLVANQTSILAEGFGYTFNADPPNNVAGNTYSSFVERIQLPIDNSVEYKKNVSYVQALVDKGNIAIKFKGSDSPGEEVVLSDLTGKVFSYDNEYKLDFRENGRVFNIRIEDPTASNIIPWRVSGYGIKIEAAESRGRT